jgi:RNA polymerase sigma factor (sigma-70 family)
MNLLNLLAAYHKEWIKMAYKFGAGAYAEDIVQEMYLRLNKYVDDPERIMYGDEPNKLFIWVTLRNMVRKFQDKKDLLVFVDEYHDHDEFSEELGRENEESLDRFLDTIFDKAREMHWFDYKMFELYHTTDLSMRDIEKETTISLRTIFTTLNKAKEYVRENLYEEYEEYKKEILN